MINAEELLAGSKLSYDIEIPASVLMSGTENSVTENRTVKLKPLTVHDLQLITRAARENDTLVAVLMVQRSLVEPVMSVVEVSSMHVGLLNFLFDRVNTISGITASAEQLDKYSSAPLVRASFTLAQEFGWTPQQINELTLGQILLHLQLVKEKNA